MLNSLKRFYDSLGRYRALYLLSTLELIIIISWSLYLNGKGNPDTPSYYSAFEVILSGKIDELRTPLYPLVVGLIKSVLGSTLSKAGVYIFQSLIFVLSIKWVGKTLESITSHKRVSYWFTAIYALYPDMLASCGSVMTESLSMSLMAAAVYLTAGAYYHNSQKKAALSGLVCLMLWMIRPALIPVTLIMILFWGIMLIVKGKQMRKTATYGICAALISLAAVGIYSMMFYKEYNKAGVSCVTTWNNYLTIRQSGVIDTSRIKSPQLKKTVGSIIDNDDTIIDNDDTIIDNDDTIPDLYGQWAEIKRLHEECGLEEFDSFVNDQIKFHYKEIISFIYHDRLEDLLDSSCVSTGGQGGIPFLLASMTRLIRVNTATAFLIFLIAACILVFSDMKKRRISYYIWLLFLLFIEHYLTILFGAPDAFTRLSTPNYPVLIAVSCWLLDQLVGFAAADKNPDN